MPAGPSTVPVGKLLDEHLAQLSLEVEGLFAETRVRAREEFAEQLNQAARRLRIAFDPEELCATLLDAAAQFSTGAALFRITRDSAKGEGIRGVPEESAEAFRTFEVALSSAAALASAVETRDPLIATTTASEVSEALVQLVAHGPDARAYLFPVVVRERVPALLYAWGAVLGPAVELLAQVAAAVWSAVEPEPEPAVELITIAPAITEPASASGKVAVSWEALPVEEQRLHLRAQRFARVQIAEMRLFQAEAVQSGRTHCNLYDALRKPIDAARETFRTQFFAPCPSMVDYLHLELARTLAYDDADLLGKTYPGPLV
jgi:hypothetical protein